MILPPKKPSSRPYNVGYGKPPRDTRFKKGASGNPGGRPRGITSGRALKLALQEIYRPVKIREGDRVTSLLGFQLAMPVTTVLRETIRSQFCDHLVCGGRLAIGI
jgi:hypothetical protein